MYALLLGAAAAAVELALPAGADPEPWRSELALVEAGLPLPAGAELRVEAAPEGWSIRVSGPTGQSPPFTVAASPAGIREGIWVAAAILRRAPSGPAWTLPPPPQPRARPRGEPPTEAPTAGPPEPGGPGASEAGEIASEAAEIGAAATEPTAPEPAQAPAAQHEVGQPAAEASLPPPVPPPPGAPIASAPGRASPSARAAPDPYELSAGLGLGSGASWTAGGALSTRWDRWSAELRFEAQRLRDPRLVLANDLPSGRTAASLSAASLLGRTVAVGPALRVQVRPDPSGQRVAPHAAAGLAGKLRLRARTLGVGLRVELVAEPFREEAQVLAPSGTLLSVRSPAACLTGGIDLGLGLRPSR